MCYRIDQYFPLFYYIDAADYTICQNNNNLSDIIVQPMTHRVDQSIVPLHNPDAIGAKMIWK